MVGVFIYFWLSIRKHDKRELARIQQRKEEQERRDAEVNYRALHKKVRNPPAKRPRSSPPTVATPRKAAPVSAPVRTIQRTTPIPATTPAPSPVRQDDGDNLSSAIAGVAIGMAISSLLEDDRPSQAASCSVNDLFTSGGGGDFGGGGADSTWDSSSSSSDSSSTSSGGD